MDWGESRRQRQQGFTPESLLTAEDIKAMVRKAENERDKALTHSSLRGRVESLRKGQKDQGEKDQKAKFMAVV